MKSSQGARRVPLGAEVALAFAGGAASFTVLGVTIAVTDSDAVAVLLAVAAAVAVIAVARSWGVAYAIPAAIAALVAYDWFRFPPTHPDAFPDAENLLSLLLYLAVGALVGELAAHGIRRAEVSEAARRGLAEEQAALRRVATLVAREASQGEVFEAIAEETGRLLGTENIRMYRYEDVRSAVVVAAWGYDEFLPVGSRHPLGGVNSVSRVFKTRQPVRIDDYGATASGHIGEQARSSGIRTMVATPIVVEGRFWGAIAVGTAREEPLPDETESRLGQFTELLATAIANTESHARADRIAQEQAALRRVATLVAKELPAADVFAKVAEEAANVLGEVECTLLRAGAGGTASVVAAWGPGMSAIFPLGTVVPLTGDGVAASVVREGRPRRIDDYSAAGDVVAQGAGERGIRSAVGCPIVVGGRTWGAMVVARFASGAEPIAPGTESRIEKFADLVATAIANAEARAEVQRLAAEQAALRRVATLVAEGVPPSAVLDAVVAEMEALLDADQVALNRFEPGEEIVVLAHRGLDVVRTPVGSRVSTTGESVTAFVRRTGRPARIESYDGAEGALAELARTTGLRSSVSAPIMVEGRLWGLITASWKSEESPPSDTEQRMVRFAELLETAIANADSRDQLEASRARLLTAADEARRRVVRDLHDGGQQRLVHAIVTLKLAQRALDSKDMEAESLLREALEHAERSNAELRELAHGLLPAVLMRGGLLAGVEAVVARLDLPVDVEVPAQRFPAETEASAYFVIAEALTNVARHSHAARAVVKTSVEHGMLHVEIRDDGVGGADPGGHGLLGIGDRVTALGGRLTIHSPAGGGTIVAATLPLTDR